MKLNLLLFAGLAELLGSRTLKLEVDEASMTVSELKAYLGQRYPHAASALANAYFAVNQQYADDSMPFTDRDEIAVIPPVSGGEPEPPAELTREAISVEEVAGKVLHPDHGASLVFAGTTREWTKGKRTVLLQYDAYEPMALKTMNQIIEEIAERWPGACCAITHRLGTVAVKEISVVIAVSAPHRDAVYEASRYAIERLKQIVPIWKKELWEDGSEWKGHQLGPWNPVSPEPPAWTGEGGKTS